MALCWKPFWQSYVVSHWLTAVVQANALKPLLISWLLAATVCCFVTKPEARTGRKHQATLYCLYVHSAINKPKYGGQNHIFYCKCIPPLANNIFGQQFKWILAAATCVWVLKCYPKQRSGWLLNKWYWSLAALCEWSLVKQEALGEDGQLQLLRRDGLRETGKPWPTLFLWCKCPCTGQKLPSSTPTQMPR